MSRFGESSAGNACVALRIQLLGGFCVEVGDRVVADSAWRLQKARGLVKQLALARGHRLGREETMERLWPEAERDAALNNLYFAVRIARGALDRHLPGKTGRCSVLQLSGGVLALSPTVSVTVDVDTFYAAASAARLSDDPRAYNVALDLYAGEVLPDDLYEDWAARRVKGCATCSCSCSRNWHNSTKGAETTWRQLAASAGS